MNWFNTPPATRRSAFEQLVVDARAQVAFADLTNAARALASPHLKKDPLHHTAQKLIETLELVHHFPRVTEHIQAKLDYEAKEKSDVNSAIKRLELMRGAPEQTQVQQNERAQMKIVVDKIAHFIDGHLAALIVANPLEFTAVHPMHDAPGRVAVEEDSHPRGALELDRTEIPITPIDSPQREFRWQDHSTMW